MFRIALAAFCAVGVGYPAGATGLKPSTGAQSEILAMRPGDQLVLTAQNATIDFAGSAVVLTGFTGIMGYASDVAYVVAISGTAAVADQIAARGRLLILPPFGERPIVARFDADRLLASWDPEDKTEFAFAYAELEAIAKNQARGIFFGALGRTRLNVAASGAATEELARRSIVGGAVAQSIRFSESGDTAGYQKAVIVRFAQALANGDIDTVSQLMDPLPFGLSDMRGAPGDARSVAAQHLAFERNWSELLGAAAPEFDAEKGVWTIAGRRPVFITMRNSKDMPFIKSIRVGG